MSGKSDSELESDVEEYYYPESEDEILQKVIVESLNDINISDKLPPLPVLLSQSQSRQLRQQIIDLTEDEKEEKEVAKIKYDEERYLKAQQDFEYEQSLKEDLDKQKLQRLLRFECLNGTPKEEPKIYTDAELNELKKIQNTNFFDNLGKKSEEYEDSQKQQQMEQQEQEKKVKERKRLASERFKALEKRFKF
jgi:hypothetical protein